MRTAASKLLALVFVVVAGCAGGAAVGLTPVEPTCLVLFRNYDNAVQVFGREDRNSDGSYSLLVPPAVSRTGQRLRENGCLTTDADLAPSYLVSDAQRGGVVGESGAPIRRISLHAGIVSGITSEVQARQYFGSLGLRVRSIGAPGLGRRIYVGPFATEGGLAEATDLALRAGFVAPYPARF